MSLMKYQDEKSNLEQIVYHLNSQREGKRNIYKSVKIYFNLFCLRALLNFQFERPICCLGCSELYLYNMLTFREQLNK